MPAPILPRIARGDPAAVEECLDRYGGLVWSLARRFSPTPADAEDAVQEIFVDLWRNAWRFHEELGKEATFISVLARRRLVDRRRRADRLPQLDSLDAESALAVSRSGDAPIELAEESRRAVDCLHRLGDKERRAVELSVYGGLSQSMIAERIDTPLGSVKTLIRRALLQMRDCMGVPRMTAPAREGSVSS